MCVCNCSLGGGRLGVMHGVTHHIPGYLRAPRVSPSCALLVPPPTHVEGKGRSNAQGGGRLPRPSCEADSLPDGLARVLQAERQKRALANRPELLWVGGNRD